MGSRPAVATCLLLETMLLFTEAANVQSMKPGVATEGIIGRRHQCDPWYTRMRQRYWNLLRVQMVAWHFLTLTRQRFWKNQPLCKILSPALTLLILPSQYVVFLHEQVVHPAVSRTIGQKKVNFQSNRQRLLDQLLVLVSRLAGSQC